MRKPALRRVFSTHYVLSLSNYLGDHSCAHGLATFANSKTHLLFHGDRGDELDLKGHGVARHHHFHAFLERYLAGDVGSSHIELRLVAGEERRVAAALLLGEDV